MPTTQTIGCAAFVLVVTRQPHRPLQSGVGMTMTASSAAVAEDGPPAFGNLHAHDGEMADGVVEECRAPFAVRCRRSVP